LLLQICGQAKKMIALHGSGNVYEKRMDCRVG